MSFSLSFDPYDNISEIARRDSNIKLYEKWIAANNVEDIEFEEIKTINNDKRTNLEVSLPTNDIKCISNGTLKE